MFTVDNLILSSGLRSLVKGKKSWFEPARTRTDGQTERRRKTDGLCVRMKNNTISLQLYFYFCYFLLCAGRDSHCFISGAPLSTR